MSGRRVATGFSSRPGWPFVLNASSPQANRLEAWLPLTPGCGGLDLARQTVATAVNSPAWTGVPTVGAAPLLVKTSDQYFDLGNPTRLQITGNLTISVWFFMTSVPASATDYMIVTKDAAGQRAYTLDLENDSTNSFGAGAGAIVLRAYINGGGSNQNNGSNLIASSISLAALTVYHAAMVYTTAGTLDLYINGVSNQTQRTGELTSIPTSTANAMIGRRQYVGFTSPFNGSIWDVRIWNRALKAPEIRALYDPSTRLDLYAVPHRRIAPSNARRNVQRVTLVNQAVLNASFY